MSIKDFIIAINHRARKCPKCGTRMKLSSAIRKQGRAFNTYICPNCHSILHSRDLTLLEIIKDKFKCITDYGDLDEK